MQAMADLLIAADVMQLVSDPQQLALSVIELFSNKNTYKKRAKHGLQLLADNQHALARHMQLIDSIVTVNERFWYV